jgi:hypothetical protein
MKIKICDICQIFHEELLPYFESEWGIVIKIGYYCREHHPLAPLPLRDNVARAKAKKEAIMYWAQSASGQKQPNRLQKSNKRAIEQLSLTLD